MAYDFTPKGIDIRVNKGKKKPKPNEAPCDWEGCEEMGGCKAPKSPDKLREYFNFCAPHAREYNKNWNFFSGMSETDISEWQKQARHGHRPTWDVRKNTAERSQAFKNRRGKAAGSNIFGGGGGSVPDLSEAPRRRISKMQLKALHDMGLDEGSSADDVRKRYTQLVKQLHPDANKGDRSTEESFARVVKAYKILKGSSLS